MKENKFANISVGRSFQENCKLHYAKPIRPVSVMLIIANVLLFKGCFFVGIRNVALLYNLLAIGFLL